MTGRGLQQPTTKGRWQSAATHAAVAAVSAVVALAAVRMWTGQDRTATAEPAQPPADADASPATDAAGALAADAGATNEADETDVGVEPTALPQPASAASVGSPPFAITTDPPSLRVWHNTQMTLRAIPDERERERFVRFVWHFEDGAQPIEGDAVDHTFPESVTDRHVTVEGFRRDGSRLVISRRLPIERLPVVPIDGEETTDRALPRARGPRVLWLQGGSEATWRAVLEALAEAKLNAVVFGGSVTAAARLGELAAELLPHVPLLRVGVDSAATAEAPPSAESAWSVVRAATGAVAQVPNSEAVVIGRVALVFVDTRPMVLGEDALGAVHDALERASAWPMPILVSARPLSALLDEETVADRAYRLYEYALRDGAQAVVSLASGVAYDGRYGGIAAVAVGRLRPEGCARLRGTDQCQSGTATLMELRERGQVRAYHLVGPDFRGWLDADALPASVGRYRR